MAPEETNEPEESRLDRLERLVKVLPKKRAEFAEEQKRLLKTQKLLLKELRKRPPQTP